MHTHSTSVITDGSLEEAVLRELGSNLGEGENDDFCATERTCMEEALDPAVLVMPTSENVLCALAGVLASDDATSGATPAFGLAPGYKLLPWRSR